MHQPASLMILQSNVRLVNPHINTDDRNILSPLLHIFETLIQYQPGGEFSGVLAESWTVSEDARRWTFLLKRPVYFHDGTLLTAQHVVTAFNRIIDPQTHGELGTRGIYSAYFQGASLQAVDAQTIQITTPEPMADLLDFIAKFPIALAEPAEQSPQKMSGTGPYKLASLSAGRLVVESFDSYWGPKPAFDRLTWQEEPDPQRRADLLLTQQADAISDVPTDRAEEIQKSTGAKLRSAQSSLCTVFLCNHFRGICQDKRIRQALNYGLDKQAIIRNVMRGYAHVLSGPLSPLHIGYNPETMAYPYQPELAKQLIAQAGYPHGLALVLDVPQKTPDEAVAIAKEMVEQYKKIGIQTTIREFSDRPAYADMVRSKQIDDACCFDSSPISTYQVLSDKFHSELHGAWWQGYRNPQIDALIDQARQTTRIEARKSIYRQVYQTLRDDAPWIYLYTPVRLWGVQSAIEDYRFIGDGLIRFG